MLDKIKNTRILKMIETGEDAPTPSGRGLIEILRIGNTDRNENINYGNDEFISKLPPKSNEKKQNASKLFGESLLNFSFN